MLIEIILFMFLGILFGTFTGLIPGIHTNLISTIILSLSASAFFFLESIYLIALITSMAITHTFVSFIPSVFLGCPDTDTELSVLPGHEMLKRGQGQEAITLASYGGLLAIIILIIIAFPSSKIIPQVYSFLSKNLLLTENISISIMALFLILISTLLISLEKKKSLALLVFFLTGALGFGVLNLNLNEPLLPLLTGLFGASMLLMTIKTKTQIPKQNTENQKPALKEMTSPLANAFLGSFVASPLLSLLPGLGSGQAAIIGDTLSRKLGKSFEDKETTQKDFLVLLGATNTLVMGFSFVALYLVSRTRTGAAAAIEQIAGEITPPLFIMILIITVLSGTISFFITLNLSGHISKKINSINYTKISMITLTSLIMIIALVSGIKGIAVLAISTLTGIYCISLGVRRTNMMGCLLLPTIIFYLRI
ncbi:MAG: tripartite tricarboxylate transporter permease [Nanoarchaeota archaeon]|nr:tripartite tricarboxylate transporter permease [Nanoarchaeota archaeon]